MVVHSRPTDERATTAGDDSLISGAWNNVAGRSSVGRHLTSHGPARHCDAERRGEGDNEMDKYNTAEQQCMADDVDMLPAAAADWCNSLMIASLAATVTDCVQACNVVHVRQ